MKNKSTTVLAISSGGGHWVQLLRLRPALADCDVIYATVRNGYSADIEQGAFIVIPDCNRSRKMDVLRCGVAMFLLLARTRPDVVISTGAAPGYLAIRMGRWFGAQTIWIDSVANVEELSRSGQMAGRHASLWLTQWQHLAHEGGPRYIGSVL